MINAHIANSLTTALGLLAIIVIGNRPVHKIEYPMVLVILGWLITSAQLNLFTMPLIYWKFGHRPVKDDQVIP